MINSALINTSNIPPFKRHKKSHAIYLRGFLSEQQYLNYSRMF